jgi:hypothetical protein
MSEVAEQSLNDVLKGTEQAETPEPAKVETAPEPEVKATEPEVSPTATESKPKDEAKEDWTKAAVLDERRKRQELERKLAEIESKANAKPKRPDLFEDPDGALSYIENNLREETRAMRTEMARELMRTVAKDYDEVEAEFIEAAKDNPLLLNELANAQNPAKYAYEMGQKMRQMAQMKDTAAYEAKVRAELEAKIRAEIQAEQEAQAGKRKATQVPSLAAAQSRGAIDAPVEESLEAILSKRGK